MVTHKDAYRTALPVRKIWMVQKNEKIPAEARIFFNNREASTQVGDDQSS